MPFKYPQRLNRQISLELIKKVDNFLFDCDGVIWLWPSAIAGSVEFINTLKQVHNKRCFFLTNNSTKTRERVTEMLRSVGIVDVNESDVVSTAWLLAEHLKEIKFTGKVYAMAGAAVGSELDKAEIRHLGIGDTTKEIADPSTYDFSHNLTLDPEVQCVAVGYDHYFNYTKLVTGTTYFHRNPGCLFIATNDDASFPTSSTSRASIPGCGVFVSAVQTSIGQEPLILGKPHKTMWSILNTEYSLDPARTCMIGDRLDTDIAFAANNDLGFSIAVLTGITNEKEIKHFAERMSAANGNEEAAKCVPDYFIDCLGDIGAFIDRKQ